MTLQEMRAVENVVVGFTLGDAKPVSLDLRRSGASKNTLIVGTSGSGKSVLGRMAITQGARLGFKVIILELKDEPDYGPWYPNIKPYITRSSDPDILGELLDLGTDKIDLLIHLEVEDKSWEEIMDLLQKASKADSKTLKEYKLSPRDRRNAQSIRHYLKQLMETLNTLELSDDLKNIPQVSVMNLRHVPVEIQQIVARSVMQWILENAQNTILFIDEVGRITPQASRSAAQTMAIRYAAEGRAKGDFLIAMNQSCCGETPILIKTLAGVKLVAIHDLVDPLFAENEQGIRSIANVEILSYANGRVDFKPVSAVYRHPVNNGKIFRIKTNGRDIRLTGYHSVFKWGRQGIEAAEVSALKVGEMLVTFMGANLSSDWEKSRYPSRLMGQYLAEGSPKGNYVGLAFGAHETSLARDARRMGRTISSFPAYTRIYPSNPSVRNVIFRPEDLAPFKAMGKDALTKRLPSWLFSCEPIVQDAFFRGYLEGDGHYNPIKKVNVSATASKWLSIDTAWMYHLVGLPNWAFTQKIKERMINDNPVPETTAYYTYSTSFRDKSKKGKGSLSQRVPTSLLGSALESVGSRLPGRWRGSKTMDRYSAYRALAWLAGKHPDNQEIVRFRDLCNSSLGIVQVKEIEEIVSDEMVYDVSVPGAEKFFGGETPLLLHNSITGVNDDVRTNILQWVLGKQTDITKAKRVKNQIKAVGLPLELEDVTRLRTGEFYLCDFNELEVNKFFAWADWVDEKDAIAVAKGEKRVRDLPPPPDAPAVIPGVDLWPEDSVRTKEFQPFERIAEQKPPRPVKEENWDDEMARIEVLEKKVEAWKNKT